MLIILNIIIPFLRHRYYICLTFLIHIIHFKGNLVVLYLLKIGGVPFQFLAIFFLILFIFVLISIDYILTTLLKITYIIDHFAVDQWNLQEFLFLRKYFLYWFLCLWWQKLIYFSVLICLSCLLFLFYIFCLLFLLLLFLFRNLYYLLSIIILNLLIVLYRQ